MWTYCESRKAWYLHQFLKEQPDLNFRNPLVKQEMKNILRFWLENKNVDGFRIDALKHLFESDNFKEEPVRPDCKLDPNDPNLHYDEQIHIHTTNQLGTYQELAEWRAIFDEVSKKTGRRRFLIHFLFYFINFF
jgi:glycosidase